MVRTQRPSITARRARRGKLSIIPEQSQRHRFGSDVPHLDLAPPMPLTSAARGKLLKAIAAGIDMRHKDFQIAPNQVTPAMPVQLGIDLIFERAAWFEPARNRLEMYDGNVYLRLAVSRPNVPHAVTFAVAHRQTRAAFSMAYGRGVAASASTGEGFLGEGAQNVSLAAGSRFLGVVFVPRAGSWWVMLTSVTKDFLWQFYSADVTILG